MTYAEYIQKRDEVEDAYIWFFMRAVEILEKLMPELIWENYYLISFDEKNFNLELYENDGTNTPFYIESFPAFILEEYPEFIEQFARLYRYYTKYTKKTLVNKEEEYKLNQLLECVSFCED